MSVFLHEMLMTSNTSINEATNNKLIAIAHNTTPFITMNQVTSSGANISTKLANPTNLPAGTGNGVAFLPTTSTSSGGYVAIAHDISPYVTSYSFTKGMGGIFGSRSIPASPPTGTGNDVAFSPDGNFIAVAHATTPFISVYQFTGGNFGTKYTPVTPLPGTGNSVAFSPDGNFIAVAHATTPFISVYNWSAAGFGAKVADPTPVGNLPAGTGNGIAWHPSGSFIALAHSVTPFVTVYPWTGTAFGTKIVPATPPAGTGNDVAFRSDGAELAVAHSTTPFFSYYPWTGTFGARSVVSPALPGAGNGVAYTPSSYGSISRLAVAHNNANFVTTIFGGGNLSSPATANRPASTGNDVAYSP